MGVQIYNLERHLSRKTKNNSISKQDLTDLLHEFKNFDRILFLGFKNIYS